MHRNLTVTGLVGAGALMASLVFFLGACQQSASRPDRGPSAGRQTAARGPSRTRSPARPNIIVFLVDDYDKPETSVYGGRVLTPNLDRLAREGMTFHNAYVTSTVCTPSRYTFLTGRYAGASTFPDYLKECPRGSQGLPGFNVGLEDDNKNVGRVLADNGYATGFVGKYHVGPLVGIGNGKEYGLHDMPKNAEYTDTLNRQFRENEKTLRKRILNQGFTWAKNIYWGNPKPPFRTHNPDWTIEAALEFIEAHQDGPFFLHYATTLLHGPNGSWFKSLSKPEVTGEGILKNVPADWLTRRASVMKRIREAGLTEDEAGYLWMDDSLGLLLDKLDALGIAENTVVLFIADHGSVLKGSLYKARGTEVPCIMRWPAGIKKNVQCHELIQNTDFVPTWFELAGVKVPASYGMHGVSITPLFARPETAVRAFVYGEMGAARCVRTKEWSYIALRFTRDQIQEVQSRSNAMRKLLGLVGGVSRGSSNPNAFSYDQLYHLATDPKEQDNLATRAQHAEKLAELKSMLTSELKRFPDRPYGEFIPGGNAMPIGSFDSFLDTVRQASLERSKMKRKERKGR